MTAARLCLSDTLKTGDFSHGKRKAPVRQSGTGIMKDKRPLNYIHDPLEAAHAIHTAVSEFGNGAVLTSKYDPRFSYLSIVKRLTESTSCARIMKNMKSREL